MDTQENERLSLLLDDELDATSARRVLARLAGGGELDSAWRRYHVIRQGMRGEYSVSADADFAARIERRLAAEPVFAPPRGKRREWLRPIGGLALAASLSALAVFGMRQYGVAPLPYSAEEWMASGGTGEVQQAGYALLSTEKLNEYLVMHNEGVVLAGAGDMLPQARVVSIANP